MSYQPRIEPKSRKAARFISRLQKAVQKAFVETGKTQQEIATILEVDRSVINRRLRGNANLTSRSIAEFAYAFDKEIELRFVEKKSAGRTNTAKTSPNVVEFPERNEKTTAGTVRPEMEFSLERTAQ